ncbi:MAG: hypothetical protein M1300_07240 [Epsilonproteobacteria bacterium]|nr:hypothetical protein [Campylobacterota bacterium]
MSIRKINGIEVAVQQLEKHSMSMQQAYEYILEHVESAESIYKMSKDYGLTTDMLVQIVGNNISHDDVIGYFSAHGLNASGLDNLADKLEDLVDDDDDDLVDDDEDDEDDDEDDHDDDLIDDDLVDDDETDDAAVDTVDTGSLSIQVVAQQLKKHNISMQQAHEYILEHSESAETVYNMSKDFGFTTDMLVQIVGNNISHDDVVGYFSAHGLNASGLDIL